MSTALIILIYGILVLAGGVLGYVRANSIPSLAAGGIAGLVLIGASAAMWRGAYSLGWWVALIVAALLLFNFGSTVFRGNFKLMPGGLMILLSIIALIALVIGGRTPRVG